MVKSLKLQIEFVDKKLLKLYGFKNIVDYEYELPIGEPESCPINLVGLNELIEEFRKIFHAKNFSLHKTQYKILTKSQAICLLKTCLEITSIPFDVSLKKNKKYLRLISKNNILDNYINSLKMSENRTFEEKTFSNEVELKKEPTMIRVDCVNKKSNATFQINSTPPEPKIIVSPWMQSIIKPDSECSDLTNASVSETKSIGVNCINSNLRNTTFEIRSDPPKPIMIASPWKQSTIMPNSHYLNSNNSNISEMKSVNFEIDKSNKYVEKIENITKEQLNENIKKVIPFEYYLQANKLIKTNESEKIISIDISSNSILRNKTLKSLCVEIVSKTFNEKEIISSHFISHLISDLEYKCITSRPCEWSDKFVQGQNCLISGIILPLSVLIHHKFYVYITKLDKILNVLDNLELKISGEYVELYQAMEKKLNTHAFIEQEIILKDKYNVLRISAGLSGMAYEPFLSKEAYYAMINKQMVNILPEQDLHILKPSADIINESEYFSGIPISLNKKNGFEITNTTAKFNDIDISKVFNYDYDFVALTKCIDISKNIVEYCRTRKNNNYVHSYKINISKIINYSNSVCAKLEIMIPKISSILSNNNTDTIPHDKAINNFIAYWQSEFVDDNCKGNFIPYVITNDTIKFNFDTDKILLILKRPVLNFCFDITNDSSEIPTNDDIIMLIKIIICKENYSQLFVFNSSCVIKSERII